MTEFPADQEFGRWKGRSALAREEKTAAGADVHYPGGPGGAEYCKVRQKGSKGRRKGRSRTGCSRNAVVALRLAFDLLVDIGIRTCVEPAAAVGAGDDDAVDVAEEEMQTEHTDSPYVAAKAVVDAQEHNAPVADMNYVDYLEVATADS